MRKLVVAVSVTIFPLLLLNFPAAAESSIPIGTILPYGGTVKGGARASLERQGWFVCDGDKIRRQEYPNLFDVIGTLYGNGNDQDPATFNLPDFRGRFVRGVDHGAGRDPDAKDRTRSAGQSGNYGDAVGSLQDDDLAHHVHNWQGYYSVWHGSGDEVQSRKRVKKDSKKETTDKDGGHSGKETRPKNIYVNWIIYGGGR